MRFTACRADRLAVVASLVLLVGGTTLAQAPAPEVTLKVVKYDELGEIIRQLRGKVVAVDFWADS